MKSKLSIGILVLAFLFCQGLAFAEIAEDVVAVAEDMTVDPVTGVVEDTVVAEDLDTGTIVGEDTVIDPALGIVEDTMVAEDLDTGDFVEEDTVEALDFEK